MIPMVVVAAFALALSVVAIAVTIFPISIWTVRRYTNTWLGLDLQVARAKIKRGQLTEETWRHGRFSGQALVVNYKRYTLRLMGGDEGTVIDVSVEIVRNRTRQSSAEPAA
jgi:hypothetical protein